MRGAGLGCDIYITRVMRMAVRRVTKDASVRTTRQLSSFHVVCLCGGARGGWFGKAITSLAFSVYALMGV